MGSSLFAFAFARLNQSPADLSLAPSSRPEKAHEKADKGPSAGTHRIMQDAGTQDAGHKQGPGQMARGQRSLALAQHGNNCKVSASVSAQSSLASPFVSTCMHACTSVTPASSVVSLPAPARILRLITLDPYALPTACEAATLLRTAATASCTCIGATLQPSRDQTNHVERMNESKLRIPSCRRVRSGLCIACGLAIPTARLRGGFPVSPASCMGCVAHVANPYCWRRGWPLQWCRQAKIKGSPRR